MIIYLANKDDVEMLYVLNLMKLMAASVNVFTRKYPNYNCLDRYLSLNQVDSNMEIWMCGLLMEFVVKSSFMFEDFLLLDALIPN